MKLQLTKSVKYRSYGEHVYLRNIALRKDYLFNDIVFDILEIIKNAPGCTEEHILHSLAEIYDVDDIDTFVTDIVGFLEELLHERILTDDATPDQKQDAGIDERIREQCRRDHRLYSVCLELTYRCNERCIHCYIDDQVLEKELRFEQYQTVIDELEKMGCPYLLLTGGEPTLHPDFLKIAEYASKKGFLVDIYTNGFLISEDMLRRMIALTPNSISFSFYGGDAENHDAITCVQGSFEKSLKAMMMCKCAGVETYIKSVAMKQNFNGLEKLYKLGELLEIPVVVAKFVIPSHTGKKAPEFYQLDMECQYKKLLDLEQQYLGREIYKRHREPGMPFCSAGEDTLSIDPYGNVSPCNSLKIPLGNITSQSIREIWDNSVRLVRKSLPNGYLRKKCETCEYIQFCNVCPGTICGANGERIDSDKTCLMASAVYHTYIERKEAQL